MTKPLRLKNEIRDAVEGSMKKASQHSKKGKHSEAIAALETALALIPEPKAEYWETARMRMSLASETMLQRKFEEALRLLDQAAERPEVLGLPVFHLNRGICFLRMGREDDAVLEFRAAMQNVTPPSDWKAFFVECGAEEAIALIEPQHQ